MSELDLTSSEAKATYEEIQEYVMSNTGLQISNLNIAQTKSEESKQPKCPPEKEIAIVDALRHFKMIQK